MAGCGAACGTLPALLLLLVPALLVVAGAWYFNGKRTRDLKRFSEASGCAFDPAAAGVPDIFALELPGLPRLAGVDLFNSVGAPAPAGCRAWFADARVRSGRAGAPDCAFFTFALFELQGRALPAFSLRPEVFTDDLGGENGEDIDLPAYEEFSGQYHLRAADRMAAERLFVSLVEFLGPRPGWTIAGKGPHLLVYKPDTEAPAGGYGEFVRASGELAAAFHARAPRQPA
ncbi:MAG: hypothetical protein PHV33_06495 [Elusimicrobiales bacterium]|nr:hypothetical protein [Elusimicrobiales bacterium]